eukprot:GFUD01084433.1.p1 GENE.GFUD01084433.1~~GFUD01084433.1.p1  ORF type:complete len:102 (+),score=6.60 GFUD01084433.1:4-309(+)
MCLGINQFKILSFCKFDLASSNSSIHLTERVNENFLIIPFTTFNFFFHHITVNFLLFLCIDFKFFPLFQPIALHPVYAPEFLGTIHQQSQHSSTLTLVKKS